MAEPPLTDRERRIIRGLIDDHEYRRVKRQVLGEWWKDSRLVVAVLGGAILLILEVVQIVVALHGGK